MLARFTFGLVANLVFVATGVAKQYLIAKSLSVNDFGSYGTVVAQAALLLVALPFPAYLGVMIRGFSAAPTQFGTRKALIRGVRIELALVGLMGFVIVLGALAAGALGERGEAMGSVILLALLLVAQYAAAVVDLLLRMQQAHRRLATFMAVRNLPAVLVLCTYPIVDPMQVVLLDFITGLLIALTFLSTRELRVRLLLNRRAMQRTLSREHLTLWLARLVQFGNSSLLRLLVPALYGTYETGLFFFAMIAQLPCSLFLSVTTQFHGHTLAQLRRGDWRTLWLTQAHFVLPNALYVAACALTIPYWPAATESISLLSKYADSGALLLAVVCYGAILASDAQEYLLRSRGLSHILLVYSAASMAAQLTIVLACAWMGASIQHSLVVCACVQAVLLVCFSAYSFRRVLGPAAVEAQS